MAGVTKVNPIAATTDWEVIGKDVTWFIVTVAGQDLTASLGPLGAVAAMYNAIQLTTTIVAAGTLAATVQSFGVEGVYDTAEMEGTGMEQDIKDLGTVDGVDFSGATVTVKTLILA